MTTHEDIARQRLYLVHDGRRRIDDPKPLSVWMRGLLFLGFWLVALTAPLGFAILMLSLDRVQ